MEAKFVAPVDRKTREARLEAAAKLGRNHRRVLDDILKNSGILRVSLHDLPLFVLSCLC